MGEPKKIKKASDEQKEYLLTYMEENIEFAHDRFVYLTNIIFSFMHIFNFLFLKKI